MAVKLFSYFIRIACMQLFAWIKFKSYISLLIHRYIYIYITTATVQATNINMTIITVHNYFNVVIHTIASCSKVSWKSPTFILNKS